jgi:uncharacterized Zn-binding protein involved in type VI secretion
MAQPAPWQRPAALCTISGAATVAEDEVYTLNLASIDPGADTIISWHLYWGDGTNETITGNPTTATHTYITGYTSYSVFAFAKNEDAESDSSTTSVYVKSPIEGTVSFAGLPASCNEGTPISLLAMVSDTTATDFEYGWSVANDDETIEYGSSANFTYITSVSGSLSVTLNVWDLDGNSVGSTSQTFTVNAVSPALTLYGADTVQAGTPYTLYMSAENTKGLSLEASQIYWGDGTYSEFGYSFNTAVHIYDGDPANYTISVLTYFGFEGEGFVLEATIPVTVTVATPAVSMSGLPALSPEGKPVNLIARLGEPASATAQYAWSVTKDGNAYASTAGAVKTFGFTPDDDAAYAVTLVVTDGGLEVGRAVENMTVYNVDPTLALNGPALSVVGNPYDLTLSATDPGADTLTSWLVYWGDGTIKTVAGDTTTATHRYAKEGFYIIDAFAEGDDGFFKVENPVEMTVISGDGAVTINGLPAFSPEGTAIELTATGTAETIAWKVTKNGDLYGTPGTGLSYTFTPDDNAYYENADYYYAVSLLPSIDSSEILATGSVAVTDVAPTLTISGDPSAVVGKPYTLNLTAADPGDDSIDKWTINWGDGTALETIDGPGSNATEYPLTATHIFAGNRGDYTITSIATDEDGTYLIDDKSVFLNAAPVIIAADSGPLAVKAGQSVINIGTFSDDYPGAHCFNRCNR